MSRTTFLVLTCICGIILVWWLVKLFIRRFSKDKERWLKYVRNFKKGSFSIPLIPAFGLFFISKLVDVKPIELDFLARSFLESLASTISLMGLKFEFDKLAPVMSSCKLFAAVTYLCFIIIVVNVFLFAASILKQRLHFWNHSRWRSWRWLFKLRGNVCFIYGNNERSIKIYETYNHTKKRFIIDSFSASGNEDLFFKGVSYANSVSLDEEKKILERYLSDNGPKLNKFWKLLRRIIHPKNSDGKLFIIVNYEDDKKNIELCQQLTKVIRSVHKDDKNILSGLYIYVFGDDELDSIYQGIEERLNGCLRYFNKYKMMANDLMRRYPVTKFMDENQIDYKAAALKPGVRMTFSMVGFGKTNRRLFNNLVSDVQFNIETEDSKYAQYVPEFYLYDKRDSLYTSDLNHNYFRYKKFLDDVSKESKQDDVSKESKQTEYLDLPPLPAKLEMFPGCDVSSPSLYENMKENLKKGKSDINFVYVAFGTDLQNIEFAKKLYDKRVEWEIPNLFIFVKVNFVDKDTVSQILKEKDKIVRLIPFGEDDVIYSFNNVISDFDFRIARKIDKHHDSIDKKVDIQNVDYDGRWYDEDTYEFDRLSSYASALSIYNKLGLIGFEIADEGTSVSKEEFDSRYNKDAKKNLAESQHFRWNAYMICNGYIPSTIDQIKEERNLEEKREREHQYRRHCNLTTIAGLEEYMKLTNDESFLKHDYIMDICYDGVTRLNKVIVEKKPL